MKAKLFFVYVWRINAIILLCAGVLAIALLLVAGYMLVKPFSVDRSEQREDDVVVLPQTVDPASKVPVATLRDFEQIQGSVVLRAALAYPASKNGMYSSYRAQHQVKNYLFFNPTTRQSYWLLPPKSAHEIAETIELFEQYAAAVNQPPKAVLYVTAPATSSAPVRVLLSSPEGTNLQTVIEQADQLKKAYMMSDDRILLLYSNRKTLMAKEVQWGASVVVGEPYVVDIPQH